MVRGPSCPEFGAPSARDEVVVGAGTAGSVTSSTLCSATVFSIVNGPCSHLQRVLKFRHRWQARPSMEALNRCCSVSGL